MKRRTFLQSLAAVVSVPLAPSMPLRPAAAAMPAASVVPAQARSWAVYMSTLHGECTPQTLQSMLNISAGEAKRYVSHLIADGIIKPNPLVNKTVSEFAKTAEDKLLDKLKDRLDMKTREGELEAEEHQQSTLEREPEEERSHTSDEAELEKLSG